MGFTGQWQSRQLVFLMRQDGFDDAMHQQVGIPTNGTGEVCIGLVCQAKVTAVDRRIDGLLHGAQEHGVNLLRIGPFFGGLCNVLKFTGLGLVTDSVWEAQRLQVIAQQVFLLGRGAFVHTEQAGVLTALNEISTANVGRQHGFFNQSMRFRPHTRYYFFNPTIVITNDLGFGRFKIYRTTNGS